MIYVLAYPGFDPQVTRALDRFRAENEPVRARLVRPHLTLVFGLTGVEPQRIIAQCERVGAKTARFQVSFEHAETGYDPVEGTHKLFLICGGGRERVIALHRALYDGPQRDQFRPGLPYNPHMTIATNEDRGPLECMDPAAIGDFPLSAGIDAIDVVQVASGELRSLKTVAMSG